jgi:hypothetical protein
MPIIDFSSVDATIAMAFFCLFFLLVLFSYMIVEIVRRCLPPAPPAPAAPVEMLVSNPK